MPKIEQNLASFYSFSEEFKKRGGFKPRNEVTEFTVEAADAKIRKIFGLGEKQEVYAFTRLRFASDIPIAIESTYLPVHFFSRLEKGSLREVAPPLSNYE